MGDLQRACPGRDHVIDDDDILACHIRAEKFVSDHRVEAIYDLGVILALIEHAHIHPEDICHIDGAGSSGLIGAYDHQGVGRDIEIRRRAVEPLEELIGRLEILESGERDGILDAGIVGVKCDDVLNAHAHQLLERLGTVEGLASGTAVLAALIEERHDDRDAAGLTA